MVDPKDIEGAKVKFRLDTRADKPGLIIIGLSFCLIPFCSFFFSDTRNHPWGYFTTFALISWPSALILYRNVRPGIDAVLHIDESSMELNRSGSQIWSIALKDVAWIRNLEDHSLQSGFELLNAEGKSIATIPTMTVPPKKQKAFRAAIRAAIEPYLSSEPVPPAIDPVSRNTLMAAAFLGNGLSLTLLFVSLSLIKNNSYMGDAKPAWLLLFSFPLLAIGLYGVFGLVKKRKR